MSADLFIVGSLSGSLTGSLLGTASWSNNSKTASYVAWANVDDKNTDTFVGTASYALTASYAVGAGVPAGTISSSLQFKNTDSMTVGALTASVISASIISASNIWVDSLQGYASTMSADLLTVTTRITGNLTGSVLGTSSYSISSSYAFTSSYALNAGSSPGVISSSLQFTNTSSMTLGALTASVISASIISASNIWVDSMNGFASTMSADLLTVTTRITGNLTGSVYGTASYSLLSLTASYISSIPLPSGIISSSLQFTNTSSMTVGAFTASIISASIISASNIDSVQVTAATMSVGVLIVTTKITGSLTGSLLGTASNAISSSYSSNADTIQSALTFAGTTNLNFAGSNVQTLTVTGSVTFTTSNLSVGESIQSIITCDGTPRSFTFPAWIWLGATAPTGIAANKTGMLSLYSSGTTDSAVLAGWAVQQ